MADPAQHPSAESVLPLGSLLSYGLLWIGAAITVDIEQTGGWNFLGRNDGVGSVP